MKYAISETGEVSNAKAYTFEHLRLVVAAFCEAVGIGAVESVQDRFAPVVERLGAGVELR